MQIISAGAARVQDSQPKSSSEETAGAISIKASGERRKNSSAGVARAQDSQPKSSKSFWRMRREYKIHNHRAAVKILRESSLSRQAESAGKKQFCGCGESIRFTTKEQQEAAEPSLLWQAKSTSERQRRQISSTEISKIL